MYFRRPAHRDVNERGLVLTGLAPTRRPAYSGGVSDDPRIAEAIERYKLADLVGVARLKPLAWTA